MSARRWTDGEDAIVIALATARCTDTEIGERIDRSRTSVRTRLTTLRARGVVIAHRVSPGAPNVMWPPSRDARLIELARAGKSHDEIGLAIGCTTKSVNSRLHKLRKTRDDIPKSEIRKRIETVLAAPISDVIRKLWADGLSAGEIGKRLGITKDAVIGRVHRLGLEGRPSPIMPRKEVVPTVPAFDRRRLALGAGHPITWGALTAGTMLEGVAYPCT